MMIFSNKTVDFIGRFLLSITFLVAIPPKITKFSLVLEAIISRGISREYAYYLLVIAICCLSIGSVGLILGLRRIGSSFLLLFLVPTTFIFHLRPFESQAFFMNIGLIGALLLVFNSDRDRTSNLRRVMKLVINYLRTFLERLE